MVRQSFVAGDLDDVCVDLLEVPAALPIQLYRPDDSGDWPAGRFPVVVFTNGESQTGDAYDYIGESLASRGYVGVFVDTTNQALVDVRQESLACAISWIGSSMSGGGASDLDGHLTCDLIVGGHSRGGQAAWQLALQREEEPYATYMFDFELQGLVAVAPSFQTFAQGFVDDVPPELAVPTLIFGASLDADTRNASVEMYDRSPLEEHAALLPLPPKEIIWTYGSRHNDYGGFVSPPGPLASANAATRAVDEYLWRFLDWQVLGENATENREYLHLERFPPSIVDPLLYAGEPAYGTLSGGIDCTSLTATACVTARGCVPYDGGCEHRPLAFAAYSMDTMNPSTGITSIASFPTHLGEIGGTLDFAGQAEVGLASDLAGLTEFDIGTEHATHVLRADWGLGETETSGEVNLYDLDVDASLASRLTFRIANVTAADSSCSPVSTEPAEVTIRVMDESGAEGFVELSTPAQTSEQTAATSPMTC